MSSGESEEGCCCIQVRRGVMCQCGCGASVLTHQRGFEGLIRMGLDMERIKDKYVKAVRDLEPVGEKEYRSILLPVMGPKALEDLVRDVRPRSEGYPRRY